jgi:hypothetical protein
MTTEGTRVREEVLTGQETATEPPEEHGWFRRYFGFD